MKYSRHAKNNLRLYGITPADVEVTVTAPDRRDEEGGYLIAYRRFFRRYDDLPLKVVYVIEDDVVIISAYPLKKSYRR